MGSAKQLTGRVRSAIRVVGFVAGLGLVAAVLLASRPAASSTSQGADVRLSISRTGELGVDPAGELLVREHLAADVAATASFVVRNQTGATVAVAIRANSSFGDLDDALSLRMTARGRTWFLGSLGRLKRGSSASVVLAPAAEARVDLRVWLEPAAKREYQGRAVDVALLLRSRPADGGR